VTLRDVYLISENDERPIDAQEVQTSFPGALQSLNDDPNNYDFYVEDGDRLFALHKTEPSDAIYWTSGPDAWVDQGEMVFNSRFGQD
jgi:hypothetical protein